MYWTDKYFKSWFDKVYLYQLNEFPYEIDVLAEKLSVPWAMGISESDVIYFTERTGNLRMIQNGILNPQPLLTLQPPFTSQGEGGLLGLALDPDFSENHTMYIIYTYGDTNQMFNRVVSLTEENNRIISSQVLLDFIPGGQVHNGGRLKIGPDRKLYISTGDAGIPSLSQDINSLAGKILRIELDGRIPIDNPFQDSPVYCLGLRNPQGIAWNINNLMYASDHGAAGHDEINLILPGGNYGWPLEEANMQVNMPSNGTANETGNGNPIQKPLADSGADTWAPSGIAFINRGPWQGQLLAAALRGQELLSFTFNETGTEVLNTEIWLKDKFGRLRDVVEGKDGFIYLSTSNMDGRGNPFFGDDKIIRLMPKRST
jgi:glucose/arabinose dehydrogenase